MIHLKPFMESTGLLWRQVTKEEMARRIKGQVVDTITKAETRKIMDLLKESGRNIEFVEYNMHDKTLDINLFGLNSEELRCHYLKLNKKEINRPRMPANNLYIKSFGDSLPNVEIFKCVDDYFWVETGYYGDVPDDYFICDGIQGLLSMLDEYYTPEEKQDNS